MTLRCNGIIERARQGRYPNQLLARKLIDCAAQFRNSAESTGQFAQISLQEDALTRLRDSATKITIMRLESALKIEATWFAKVGEGYDAVQLTTAIFELRQDRHPEDQATVAALKKLRRYAGAEATPADQIKLMSEHCYRLVAVGAKKNIISGLRDATLAIVWPNGEREDVDLHEITFDSHELPDPTHPITVSGRRGSLDILYKDQTQQPRHVVYDSTTERYVFVNNLKTTVCRLVALT